MNIWMLAFLLLPVAAMTYIGWHVWCLLSLAWGWKLLVVALMVVSFLLMFAGIWRTTDTMPLPLATYVYEVGTSSIFILLYLFMLFLVLDLGRLLHLLPRTLFYQNWWTTGSIFVFIFALFLYGNLHYKNKVRQELTLTTSKALARPLRLVMLSDLHLGYHNPRKELHRWVDLINAEHPDLILIAGDIIDGSMRPLGEQRMHEEFRRLQAPVYACLGNHEYYSGEPDAQQFYRDAGIHLLQDSVAQVGDLCIIGRDDRTNRHRKPLGKIISLSPQPSDISHQNIPSSSTTSPTIWRMPSDKVSTSSSAVIPTTDRCGLSLGLPMPSTSVPLASTNVVLRATTSAAAWASGVESSASAHVPNTWWQPSRTNRITTSLKNNAT